MKTIRFLTSGESHGECLSAIIDGIPAGFSIDNEFINTQLQRRQVGYGRGERQNIERDTVKITSGVRFGKTTGAPITLVIKNNDFENWRIPMSVESVDFSNREILKLIANKSFTKVRPGHADYAGSIKYKLEDLRDVLERASARKTAIEVAVGALCMQILKEFSIKGFSHVTQIGYIIADVLPDDYTIIMEKAENSSLRCADDFACEQMVKLIDKTKLDGDTLGGKFEVVFINVPVGLGSYVQWDKGIDGILAQAVMSIPAVKAVEIGAGVRSAELFGSKMHDEIFVEHNFITRKTNNAGGIEGGMTNGETIVVKGTMKPIPTLRKSLKTIDLIDKSQSEAHFERSDTCAVPSCAVVAEARVAITLLDEFLTKFGGDSFKEIKKNYEK